MTNSGQQLAKLVVSEQTINSVSTVLSKMLKKFSNLFSVHQPPAQLPCVLWLLCRQQPLMGCISVSLILPTVQCQQCLQEVMNGVFSTHLEQSRGSGGRVLPKISDKSVLPRVLNPDPMQGQDRQKLILYLRPKSVKGKTKSKNLKEAHKSSLHRIPYTQR